MKIIVAITGASGAIYGVRLLEELNKLGHDVHLIVTKAGSLILRHELGLEVQDLKGKCSRIYSEEEIDAPPSSGSSLFEAMVIAPCSMKTLASIANGFSNNLVTRAADVILKERKKLIMVVRETPLNRVHIINMLKASDMGAVVLPACPAFYHKPRNVEGLVNYVVGKVLDQLGIEHNLFLRWSENHCI
ncbi:MAG: UbiX family flavin prenyltransferase [Candidatus Nezhaarchaeales archaeon]